MSDRLSYSEFRDEFLLAMAVATGADTGKVINPLDVASHVQGRFQESWPMAAMTDLSQSGFISGMTFLSDGGAYRVTGTGLEVAEEIANKAGSDLYELIDEAQNVETEDLAVRDPVSVISEPVNTRDLDQLKADLRTRLNILEALLPSDRSLIGHNKPPEAINPLVFSEKERSELRGEISALRDQVEEPIPDLDVVSRGASVFWRAASKAAAWLGDRMNAQVDNAIALLPSAGILGVVTYGRQLLDALHAAANAVLAWMHVLPPL